VTVRVTALGVQAASLTSPGTVRGTLLGAQVAHQDAGGGTVRATAFGVQVATGALPPDAPTLHLTPAPGGFISETGAFVPNVELPEDEHAGTDYRFAPTDDPAFTGGSVQEYSFDAPDAGLYFALLDEVSDGGTMLGQARHRGLLGGPSAWSETVEATALPLPPRADTPVVTIDLQLNDYIEASSTAFTHPDGQTTAADFDPDDPLPYLATAEWLLRFASGVVVYAPGPLPSADPPTLVLSDLAAGSYQLLLRWLNGLDGVSSLWSEAATFTVEPPPAVQPARPTVTIISAGPGPLDGVSIEGSAYSHPEDSAHTRTQVVYRLQSASSGGVSLVLSGAIVAHSLATLPAGSWNAFMRYGDAEGRWGLWSVAAPFVIYAPPTQPRVTAPSPGSTVATATLVQWEPNEAGAVAWQYQLQEQAPDSTTWTTRISWTTAVQYLFAVSDRPDGTYTLRLAKRNPTTGATSEYAYFTLRVDRTGRRSFAYQFGELLTIPETWTANWDAAFSWELEVGLGIYGRSAGPMWAERAGVLLMTEIGRPVEVETTTIFALVPDLGTWIGWRFVDSDKLRGGLAYRATGYTADGTRAGIASLMNTGAAIWPLSGAHDTANKSVGDPTRLYQYATGTYEAQLLRRGYRPTHGFATLVRQSSVPYVGDLIRGAEMQLPNRLAQYAMHQKITRSSPGFLRVQTRILGPGFDDSVGWQHDDIVAIEAPYVPSNPNSPSIPCGYCGLAAVHFRGLGHDETGPPRVLFYNFSASNISYENCEPVEPVPCPEIEPKPRRVIFGVGDRLLQFGADKTDGGIPIVGRALSREMAPEAPGADYWFRDLHFVVTTSTEDGLVVVTPIVDGERKLAAQRSIVASSEYGVEVTRRVELALYEMATQEGAQIGRKGLRGTWIQFEIELFNGGCGRLEVDGWELRYEVLKDSLAERGFHAEEWAAAEPFAGRRIMFGRVDSDALLQFAAAPDDDGTPINSVVATRQFAPLGPAGEFALDNLFVTLLKVVDEEVSLDVVVRVNGVALDLPALVLPVTAGPTRMTRRVPLSVPYLVGEVERGRQAPRGTWVSIELRTTAGAGTVLPEPQDGVVLEFTVVTESEESL